MPEKILVVDDEMSILQVVGRFLDRWGYSSSQAQSAAAAKELLLHEEYALLLTDIKMPGESGLELTKYVKSTYPDMVVIFLSVLEDQDTAEAAVQTGAFAYLTKPLRYNELLLFMQNGLHHRRLEIENRRYVTALEDKVKERTQELEKAVAELQASQQAYKESEEKFRVAIEHSNDGVAMHRQGKILYVNERFAEMFGYQSREEIIGGSSFTIVHPDDRKRVMRINARRSKGLPAPDRYEFKGLHKDGRRMDLELSVAQPKYRDMPVTLAFFRDVTSQKAVRKTIEDSEERLRKILNVVQAGILIIDRKDKTIVQANPVALKIIGAKEGQVLGKTCHTFLCPAEEEGCPLVDLGREVKKSEGILLTINGEEVHILKTVVPLTIRGQECLVESFVDISELKQAEQKLGNANQELENLFSSVSSILIQITPSGRITRWNTQAAAVFGLQDAEVQGKSLFEVPIYWDLEKLQEAVLKCRNTHQALRSRELSYQTKEGKMGLLGFGLSPLFDEQGVFSGLLLMGADITGRKNLESQLAQAQKLESIGQLAAGIAHEINTPIQYVGDNTRFFKEAFDDLSKALQQAGRVVAAYRAGDDPGTSLAGLETCLETSDLEYLQEEVPQAIEQTLQGVERVGAIVRSMKEFSHPGGEEKVLVDLNKALESTATISRNEWKYVAHLEYDLEEGLPQVPCLPGEMNQVFLNIIVNAAQAIADGGGSQGKAEGEITISTRRLAEDVEIRIKDTGAGIPEANRPYVFDPFYTTKEVGKGTGQGLALAYKTVVDNHGGSLSFESEEGQGTTFVIRLPLEAKGG
ncbi:MAG: PAS domain S-box protein [Thermodesulfobacteriota bacterium]